MNILHIWNQSAVASVISKWQTRNRDNSHVIIQGEHDLFGVGGFYANEVVYGGRVKFVLTALSRCRNYDIIHLHDAWFMVNLIKIRYPKKKIVIHYHGSMIRDAMKETRRRIWEKTVDQILVSTPDLLNFKYHSDAIWVPNPVDIELFNGVSPINNNECYVRLKKDQQFNETVNLLLDHGFNVDLKNQMSVPYVRLPTLLGKFGYVCDVPIINGKVNQADSVIGLQAMAMGIKTIRFDFSVKNSLPENHNPEYTVKLLKEIYKKL